MLPFVRNLTLLLLALPPLAAQPLVLTGATVYDGTGGEPLTDATLVIDDGRIACVGATCPTPEGAETVDLAGRFVTPGLVDAHVHFAQTGWLDGRPDAGIGTDHYDYDALQQALQANPDRWHRAYLCSGITAVYDVGGFPWSVDVQTHDVGDTERAHVRASGPLVTAFEPIFPVYEVDGENAFYPMTTDEAAVESVRRIAAMGGAAVKVWFIDPPEDQRAAREARLLLVADEARAHGLPLIVHATELRNAKAALRAGAQMLVHSVTDAPVDAEFIRLAREAGAFYAPTLTVIGNWPRALASVGLGVVVPLDDPNGCVDAETRRVIAEAPDLTESAPATVQDPAWVFAQLEDGGRTLERMSANLARVHEAGIPVVTATDAGNPLTVHGPSIYAEMEAMEAAGIRPADVLVMSTRNGAAGMGRDDLGTLAPGQVADLTVLTEDPGASTRAFRSITHVMRGGVLREVGHFDAHD
ncbi:MAG: amidohydrolase family protein [Rubricoccaceae bacterium]|nr:amidohydrolase family protein [Rubricoccaceae bacterium]